MKAVRTLLTLLCAVALHQGTVPAVAAAKAPGGDFAWTDSKSPLLIEQILQRDGLIDGIWFPWFDGGNVGHSLTGNDLMVRYRGNGWSKVAMDTVGADKIYREIYNLKAMGYNLLGYGGSIYDEGVIHDAYGDVIGVKQEFLDNARRLLDMCREIGMPVMWTICFHSSSAPNYYGMDAWNIMAQKYANPTVARHYAERFARPVCKMLAEYPDVVALVAITDEIENEINDSQEGNHFDGARAPYGVNEDDMVYFMEQVNAVCKQELPNVARTMASNDENKAMYDGFDLDLMGHNRYDNNANLPETEIYRSDAPMIMTEYNVGGDAIVTPESFAELLQKFRQQMVTKGYKGGIQWAWMHGGRHASTAYYLLDSYNNTDFIETVALMRYYIDDYRNAYQGKTVVLDAPVMYANDGTGLVEWIPSRQASKMDLLRSNDGGTSWVYVLKDVYQSEYVSKGKGRYKDASTSRSMYKVVVRDAAGNTAESAPNNVAGTEAKFKKTATTVQLDGATNIGKDYSSRGAYPLYSFGVGSNRPRSEEVNLIKNGSFESTANAGWNVGTFLKGDVSVVTDTTAPSGGKSLYFNSSGTTAEKWYTFTVPVEPDTDYIFSAWVKGSYLSDDNAGHASIGVMDPTTNKFMIYSKYHQRASRGNRQIYPTAWDDEWHLRSVAFHSADLTEITIALCGENSKLWVDDVALFKNGQGLKYMGRRNSGFAKVNLYAEYKTCKNSANLLVNGNFSSGDTFWKSGNGWKNGFLSVINDNSDHGKVLRYKEGDGYGTYYIQWIDVQPGTDYSFSFDIKVKGDGRGSLTLLDDCMSKPEPFVSFVYDTDVYGDDWTRYYIEFNTSVFSRIGVAVCNMGGEALMDNLCLFKTADGHKDTAGETVGTVATLAPTKKPTNRPTDAPVAGVTTTVGETTTTVVETTTTVAEGETTTTQPSQTVNTPDVGADTTPDEKKGGFPWHILFAAGGGTLVIAGGVVLFLILRKKKTAPPTE